MDPTIPEICPLPFGESRTRAASRSLGCTQGGPVQACRLRPVGGVAPGEWEAPSFRSVAAAGSVPLCHRVSAAESGCVSVFLTFCPFLTISAVPLRVHFPPYFTEEQLTPARVLGCR